MSREVRRVPTDFEWPTNKVWSGYTDGTDTEPPTGDGYQLWETVSEGSPVSPVFEDREGLAWWLTTGAAGLARADSVPAALRFIDAGWAPTGVMTGGRYRTGVQWIGEA